MNRPQSAHNYAPVYPNRSWEALKMGARIVTSIAVGGSALTLVGCMDAGADGPTSSPTVIASPSPEGTTAPTAENKPFTGVIDYAAFENFETKDEIAKDAACAGFFDPNLPNSTRINAKSTGPEVAQWFKERVELVSALNRDKSDPRNQSAAISLMGCLSAKHEESNKGQTILTEGLGYQLDPSLGFEFSFIDPAKVTRFSDGIFPANGEVGGAYNAYTLEGYNTGFGEPLTQQVFEWHSSEQFPSMKSVSVDLDIFDLPSGGKPPVVVDPSFANSPWH